MKKTHTKHSIISDDGKILQKRRVLGIRSKKKRVLTVLATIFSFVVVGLAGFYIISYIINSF